jgi:hypothetical protein
MTQDLLQVLAAPPVHSGSGGAEKYFLAAAILGVSGLISVLFPGVKRLWRDAGAETMGYQPVEGHYHRSNAWIRLWGVVMLVIAVACLIAGLRQPRGFL